MSCSPVGNQGQKIPLDEFNCSLTLDPFQSALITQCGHTFEEKALRRFREYDRKCPLCVTILYNDRDYIKPNRLITEMMEKLKPLLPQEDGGLIKLFLSIKRAGLSFNKDYCCALSGLPLLQTVTLPCGHHFRHAKITELYGKKKRKSTCPLDGQRFKKMDLTPNNKKMDQEAFLAYREWFKKTRKFNQILLKRANDLEVEQRGYDSTNIAKKILKFEQCPISEKLMTMPTVSHCGHTFEKEEIQEDSHCPYDGEEITVWTINYTAKRLFEIARNYLQSPHCNPPPSEMPNEPGLILHLNSGASVDEIIKIISNLLWCSGEIKVFNRGRIFRENQTLKDLPIEPNGLLTLDLVLRENLEDVRLVDAFERLFRPHPELKILEEIPLCLSSEEKAHAIRQWLKIPDNIRRLNEIHRENETTFPLEIFQTPLKALEFLKNSTLYETRLPPELAISPACRGIALVKDILASNRYPFKRCNPIDPKWMALAVNTAAFLQDPEHVKFLLQLSHEMDSQCLGWAFETASKTRRSEICLEILRSKRPFELESNEVTPAKIQEIVADLETPFGCTFKMEFFDAPRFALVILSHPNSPLCQQGDKNSPVNLAKELVLRILLRATRNLKKHFEPPRPMNGWWLAVALNVAVLKGDPWSTQIILDQIPSIDREGLGWALRTAAKCGVVEIGRQILESGRPIPPKFIEEARLIANQKQLPLFSDMIDEEMKLGDVYRPPGAR